MLEASRLELSDEFHSIAFDQLRCASDILSESVEEFLSEAGAFDAFSGVMKEIYLHQNQYTDVSFCLKTGKLINLIFTKYIK